MYGSLDRRFTQLEVENKVDQVSNGNLMVIGLYQGHKKPLPVRCKCGLEWFPKASHILTGYTKSCRDCGMARMVLTDEIVEERLSKNSSRIISIENFRGINLSCLVTCKCGYKRTVKKAEFVLRENGSCPNCAEYGFNPNEPAIVYYLRIKRPFYLPVYKIGITNRTVRERYSVEDNGKITILKTWKYSVGVKAQKFEQMILREYASDRYYGSRVLQSGNTELFKRDVLGLDRSIANLVSP